MRARTYHLDFQRKINFSLEFYASLKISEEKDYIKSTSDIIDLKIRTYDTVFLAMTHFSKIMEYINGKDIGNRDLFLSYFNRNFYLY